MAIPLAGQFDYVVDVPASAAGQLAWSATAHLAEPVELTGDRLHDNRLVGHAPKIEVSRGEVTFRASSFAHAEVEAASLRVDVGVLSRLAPGDRIECHRGAGADGAISVHRDDEVLARIAWQESELVQAKWPQDDAILQMERAAIAAWSERRRNEPLLTGRTDDPSATWLRWRTPLLPTSWPPPFHALRAYAYAYSIQGLADGAHVTSPLLHIELSASGHNVVAASAPVRILGVQGVRPLTRAELTSLDQIAADRQMIALIGTAASPDELHDIRVYVGAWCARNVVICDEIAAQHSVFMRWLRGNDRGTSRKLDWFRRAVTAGRRNTDRSLHER